MAEKKHDAPAEPKAGAKSSSSFPIFPLLNTIAMVAALAFFYYSNYIFKRPPITEDGERDRLAEAKESVTPPALPGFVSFDPVTINIEPIPGHPSGEGESHRQINGKLHYATVGFSLEIRDKNLQELVEAVRPQVIDKVIQILGKKTYQEIVTAQGRYILHAQIMDFANHLITHHSIKPMRESLVTNVYFTQFIVQ
jgi:flagellar basal body-associated protein FliL